MKDNKLALTALVISTVSLLANIVLFVEMKGLIGIISDVIDVVDTHHAVLQQVLTVQNQTLDLLAELANKTLFLEESVIDLKVKYDNVQHDISYLNRKVDYLIYDVGQKYNELSQNLSDLYSEYIMLKLVSDAQVIDKFKVYSLSDIDREIVANNYGEPISDFEVNLLLDFEFGDRLAWVDLLDEKYIAYDEDILRKVLYETYLFLNSHKYIEEYFDCDDYSIVTLGIVRDNLPGAACFGFSYVPEYGPSAHLQILCITKDREILYFEPQTGEFSVSYDYPTNVWIFG